MLNLPHKKLVIPAIPAVLLAMISVQGGASIAKYLFPVLGASGTASLRIGFSTLILLAFFRTNLLKVTKKQWLYCMAYGTCLGAMNLVFYFAIKRIPLGLGVTLEFTGPLVLALMGSRKKLDLLWVLLAGTGIALIAPWQNNNVDLLGAGLAVCAGALWAGYIVLGGKVSKVMKGSDAVGVGMLFASLFVIPFGVFSGDLAAITAPLLLLGVAVALLTSAIPYTLEIGALRQLPPKTFGILMSLHPAFAALSGLLFLREYLSLTQWASIACVVAASVGATYFSRKVR
ncbi:EamA family transporter [Pontibacter ramchanderi]|uniref:Inner membrane transporter RhtA n=1 Tax=Pontibacter ramchanderi TaxID=1179743 RepID=A0A2N3V2S2_9BACT|nr:DMT family transporter [Pontibacter ramchanderi]PKV75903.1 inner membrane transporter RhtA [Pontibacter ramchanderi]